MIDNETRSLLCDINNEITMVKAVLGSLPHHGPNTLEGVALSKLYRRQVDIVNLLTREDGPSVIDEIAAERRRQIDAEGWTPERDNDYRRGELAGAAACYALTSIDHWARQQAIETLWPWRGGWWKPTTPRRDLIKAAALIVAEIERLDRAASLKPEGRL